MVIILNLCRKNKNQNSQSKKKEKKSIFIINKFFKYF